MARDKITDAAEKCEIDALEPLDPQETKFVEGLSTLSSNVAAYKHAYGADGYSPAALRVQACRKAADPKIQAHLRVLRAHGLASASLTLGDRIEAMMANSQAAKDAGNWGAALGYDKEVNELAGFKIERHADVTDHDPLRTLNEIALTNPEYAAALAKQHNIPWQPKDAEGVSTRH